MHVEIGHGGNIVIFLVSVVVVVLVFFLNLVFVVVVVIGVQGGSAELLGSLLLET